MDALPQSVQRRILALVLDPRSAEPCEVELQGGAYIQDGFLDEAAVVVGCCLACHRAWPCALPPE